jgi:glycosyltransferase involved in cell wall biosynthesis
VSVIFVLKDNLFLDRGLRNHIILGSDYLGRHNRTGIDRYYSELMKWLPKVSRESAFSVFSLDAKASLSRLAVGEIDCYPLNLSRKRLYLSNLFGRSFSIKSIFSDADLVHLMTPIPIQSDVPVVATVFDLTPILMPKVYSRLSRYFFSRTIKQLVRRGSNFIPISKCTGDDLHRLFNVPSERIHPVYLGVNDTFYEGHNPQRIADVRKKYSLPSQYFLFTGAMNRRKNLDTLLHAFKLFLNEVRSDIKLVITGRMDWGGRELEKGILRENISESVVLPGYISESDLPIILGQAIALIYPSLYEGFGFPPLEAMACGTPVIASRAGAIPEITGGNALLIDPLDIAGFRDAMRRIIEDKKLSLNLSDQGRKWVSQFTWERTARETARIYENILPQEQ